MVEHLLTKSIVGVALAISAVSVTANADPSKNDSKQRAGWYSAPEELQILDDRPVIKECRQPPQEPQIIEISLSAPSAGSGQGWVDGGTIRFTPHVLPKSGFGKEGNACAIQIRGLPSAITTNRMMDQSSRQRGRLLRRS